MSDTASEMQVAPPLMQRLELIVLPEPVNPMTTFDLLELKKSSQAQKSSKKWSEHDEMNVLSAVIASKTTPMHISKNNYRFIYHQKPFALNHTYLWHPDYGLLKKMRKLGKGVWGSVSLFANETYQFAIKKFVDENVAVHNGENSLLPFLQNPTIYLGDNKYCISHEEQHAICISQVAGIYSGHYRRLKWGVHQDSYEQFNYSQEILYMIMPFYKGITVERYFNNNNLDKCDRVCIALAITLELEKFQNNNLVHGDLHDSNILINIDNDTPIIHIIDWDLAIQLQNSMQTLTQCEEVGIQVYKTKTWKWSYQPAHMPPEFSDGQRSLKFDIYSLGVLFKDTIGVNNPCIDKMLDDNPNMRPTICEVVIHLRNQLLTLQSQSITWQRDHQHTTERSQQEHNVQLPTPRKSAR